MTSPLPGQHVDIPLPPDLCETFGYAANCRFVSFRWAYDDLWYDDGQYSGTANCWTFQAYARHRAVAPLLDPHHLGASDHEAPFALLIDREGNLASVVPVSEARTFLRDQHPPAPEMTPEEQVVFEREFTRLLDEMRHQPIDHDARV